VSSIVTLGYSRGKLLVPVGYGGHLEVQVSSQLSANAINVLPGTRVLGFGVLRINGKVVTSPVTLVEEGYYVATATSGSIVDTLNIAVINPDTTIVEIIDVFAPATDTPAYQNLSNNLTAPFAKFANTRPALDSTECLIQIATNKAVHVSVRALDEHNQSNEITKVSATMAGRWLTAEVVLPRGLNNAKLVIPIETGDQTIGSSGGPPTSPTTGPRFWFESDFGVGIGSGSDVISWADQSGNNYNVSDAGMPPGSRHLQFVSNSVNGKPGIRGNQDFAPQSLIYTGPNFYSTANPRTVYAVVKPGGPSIFGKLGGYIFTFRRSAPEFALGLMTTGGVQRLYTDFSTIISAVTPVDYTGIPTLIRWQTDVTGSTIQTYINGVLVPQSSTTLGDELGNQGFIIGSLINDDGGSVFEGDICALIGYDGSQAPSLVTTNELYLRTKYGTP